MPLREFHTSKIYESEPLLKMQQPNYLNLVVCGLTELAPLELLKKCQQIENRLGRVRKERWEPRNIDIDILSFGNEIIDTDALKIPHPEMVKRSFVLLQLLDLSPECIHPQIGTGIRILWEKWLETHNEAAPQPIDQIINLVDRQPRWWETPQTHLR